MRTRSKPSRLVSQTIGRHHLLSQSDLVLVAFSGGADSTALALLLQELGYRIHLGHIDHGMRPESRAEAEHCRRFASSIEVPIDVTKVPVARATEAEARHARYRALEEMASKVGAQKIATAHTVDDNVETILMRLARGGRAFGIPYCRGRVVRPILDLRRGDTESVCGAGGIEFVVDPSNLDERITRNRIRHRILPGLSEGDIADLLELARANTAAARTVDHEVLGAQAKGLCAFDTKGAVLDRRWLKQTSETVAKAAIRRGISGLGLAPSGRLVGDIHRKVASQTGARLDLPGGWSAWAEATRIVIGHPPSDQELPEVSLAVPGRTIAPEWGIEVVISIEKPGVFLRDLGRHIHPKQRKNIVVDADVAGDPLHLRGWRPGDRFRPLGAPGSKKLHDFFVDAKIPRHRRGRVPILVSGTRIVWVGEGRIDEWFKLTPRSKRALRFQIFPLLRQG